MRAPVSAMRREINSDTILLYASAPTFPHGVVDPVAEIAALAKSRGIGCHVDNCLGGVLFSALQRRGILKEKPFDLSVPGVTSISVDLHKYGYSVKGTSSWCTPTRS